MKNINKIPDLPCDKCGGDTKLNWIHSSGMDITRTGMKRTCTRCGYEKWIEDNDGKKEKLEISR